MKLFSLLLLTGILLSSTFCTRPEKMNTVRIELEGHRYDSLYLSLLLNDDKRESIKGHSVDGYCWEFSYPDSIYQYINTAVLSVPTADSVRYDICFYLKSGEDTLKAGDYCFGRPSSLVKARFLEHHVFHNIPMYNRETEEVIRGTLISDSYDIITDDKELVSSIEGLYSGYGMFDSKYSYEENIERYVELTKKYPDSQDLISTLSGTMGYYRSKTDIARVFNCFSEASRQSYYGQKINRYLTRVDTVFKNQVLPTWDTGLPEAIVQDSSKYNLIVFSASWCGYCHRQIPVLKEVYQDLGDELIITYISVDKKAAADNWKKVMQENEIPWRSLVALDKGEAMYDEYAFFGIPYTLLVHPVTMKMEVLDVRKQEERSRLYEMINR